MRRKMRVAWVEKLKAFTILMPKKGTAAFALLELGRDVGFTVAATIDGVWCAIVKSDSRPGMKRKGE